MTPEQLEELRRLMRLLTTRTCRRYAANKGMAGPGETIENTQKGFLKARQDLEDYVCQLVRGEAK